MRFLLDTCTILFMAKDPDTIKNDTRKLIESHENDLIVSVVSFWEIGIKQNIGKLKLNLPVNEFVTSVKDTYNLSILPINMDHALGVITLDMIHKDPFDRMLVSIAKNENLAIVSSDEIFDRYNVDRIW